ncbi:MAG: LysR family transcriptional regulator [Stomatobaculum sp.]|nr:LysR family transcriptional regulator [Stomatobaculum sp.]
MELEYIREFTVLAEMESFTKAAGQLEMSQSLLSKHIRALEQELGIQLFARNRRTVVLGEEGKAFLPYARRFLETRRECESVLSLFREGGPERVRIGATVDLKQYGVLDLIAGFLKQHAEVEINLMEGPSAEHIKALYDKERDFVFTYEDDCPYSEIESLPVTEDDLVAVMPMDHPLGELESVSFEDLKMEEFYSVAPGSHSYRQFMRLCREAGFEPDIIYTSNSMKHLVEMIKRGRGVAVARRRQVGVWDSKLIRIVKIAPAIPVRICFFYNTAMKRSRGMEKFFRYMTETVRTV